MIKDFINLVYPNYCAGCNSILSISEKGICSSCWIDLKAFKNKNEISFFGREIVQNEIYAFEFSKNDIIQKIIHNIKYNSNKDAAFVLGVDLGKRILNLNKNIDVIIPVPVSKLKRKKRGFNQSEVIALGVNKILKKCMLNNYLTRSNNLKSQIYSSRFERFKNVENEFSTSNKLKPNLNVLIVDDVVTSGATINSCINAFQQKNINITIGALAAKII